jgi:hypothetical protein
MMGRRGWKSRSGKAGARKWKDDGGYVRGAERGLMRYPFIQPLTPNLAQLKQKQFTPLLTCNEYVRGQKIHTGTSMCGTKKFQLTLLKYCETYAHSCLILHQMPHCK